MIIHNEQTDEPLRPLLLGSGEILFLLQQLENVVKSCCAFLQIKGIQATVEDVLSEEPRKRFDTLGRILKAMKQPMGFKPSFQEKLDNFVKSRNTFIHDYWVKNKIYSIDQSIGLAIFQEIASFELALYKETIYMTQVFLGLQYSIGAVLASREGKTNEFEAEPEYEGMKKCAPVFLSVIENEER